MTDLSFDPDEIGVWSELKLDIVEKYGEAYTKTSVGSRKLKKYYIDGFSGAGTHVSKRNKTRIEGSPARALRVQPPFDRYYFIDLDADKTRYLRQLCGSRSDVYIHTGDANHHLVHNLLPRIHYKFYNRALCLLDPYGLQLNWEVVLKAGQSRAVDLFLNFPVMDMNRNAIWRNPEKVSQAHVERMNKFWGNDTWRDAAYVESPQANLFDEPETVKLTNDSLVIAFRKRLRSVAGFKFVPEPLPMRNSKNAVVYYLFFASQKEVAEHIITDIFRNYRQPRYRLASEASQTSVSTRNGLHTAPAGSQ